MYDWKVLTTEADTISERRLEMDVSCDADMAVYRSHWIVRGT